MPTRAKRARPTSTLYKRHPLILRITHWFNVFVLAVMLGSGLQIFNAHPALYWGKASTFDQPFIEMSADYDADNRIRGYTSIGDARFDTTGFLGYSSDRGRGFPQWLTLPGYQSLAMGRRWHFFFAWLFVANGIAFAVWAVLAGHLRRDLLPTLSDIRNLPRTFVEHALLRFPKGEEARRYNIIQKLTYLAVLAGLGPIIVLTGLTMSPMIDAAFPVLLDLFGGRQSARTIHFLCAFGFVLFFFVHIALVILSGFLNNMRSMITGDYRIETEASHE